MRTITACALVPIALVMASAATHAQQPTAAQTSAIRQSCRSDFMANCSGVQPGGRDALECLQRNLGKLSPSCKTAVSAITPPAAPPAPAPAGATPPAAAPPATATPASASTPPAATPSSPTPAPTRKVTAKPAPPAPAAAPGTPAPVPAVAPAVAAAPAFPQLGPVRPMLPRRAVMILAICRADQETLCASVPPGGGRVLSCLAEKSPHLSPECYKALAPVTQ